MSRRTRIKFPGAIYHVMDRGNRKGPTFLDDTDRHRFLMLLAYALEQLGAMCFAYCLMGNHFHLILCTPRANISLVMQRLNSLYAKYFNRRHQWTGHVFDGPFKGILIDDTEYLGTALAYVARNPVAAGIVTHASDWHWSSYRSTVGLCSTPPFLTLDWLPQLFEGPTIEHSRQLFAALVALDGDEIEGFPTDHVRGGIEYKRLVRRVAGATLYKARLPRYFRALGRPPLGELFAEVRKPDRRVAMLRAHVVHGYLMTEIADFLGLHPTTVSRIVNQSGSYRLTKP